jgi:hypothetical protein
MAHVNGLFVFRGVLWTEYIQSTPGQHPTLGRTPKCKESSRGFKATVAMSQDFPLTVEMLLNVLEVCISQYSLTVITVDTVIILLRWCLESKKKSLVGTPKITLENNVFYSLSTAH